MKTRAGFYRFVEISEKRGFFMNIRNDYELETLPLELPDEIEKYKMVRRF